MKPYYDDGDGRVIYHGDCREVLPSLLPLKLNLVLTDPPYGIGFREYASHEDKEDGYIEWIWPLLEMCEKHVSDGWVAVFQATKHARRWSEWFPREWRLFAMPKTFVQIFPCRGPKFATDYALFWQVGDAQQKAKGRDWFLCNTSDTKGNVKGHPCPRPLGGIVNLIDCLSEPDELVLDPFMGSGTTLRAAKDLGRKAIGIEIEERYCEIGARRLAQNMLAF